MNKFKQTYVLYRAANAYSEFSAHFEVHSPTDMKVELVIETNPRLASWKSFADWHEV